MAEPQFNPIMQLQPQQGFTNNYYRTAILEVPQNDLQQIGAALAPFSQALGRVMRQDRIQTNEKEAEAGAAEAALLTAEQRRLAAFANWTELEQTGVIPEGAHPARLIAMNEHAGRSLVEEELRATLQNNIVRYSDPSSSPEKAIQFAQEELMKLGIQNMSHYAKAAAAGAFQNVSRAWLQQVGQRRVEKTAKKNREQLTNGVSRILDGDLDSEGQKLAIEERVQDNFDKFGLNGRLEVVTALENSAMLVAEDDLMKAMTMIRTVEGLEIGGVKMREQYGDVFATLEDRVQKISEASLKLEDANEVRKSASRQRRAYFVADTYAGENALLDLDINSPEVTGQLNQMLVEQGVSEEEMPAALTRARERLNSLKSGKGSDPKVMLELQKALFDEDLSENEVQNLLLNYQERGLINGHDALQVGTSILRRGQIQSSISDIERSTATSNRRFNSTIQISMDETNLGLEGDQEASEIVLNAQDELDQATRELAQDPALSRPEQVERMKARYDEITERTKNELEEYAKFRDRAGVAAAQPPEIDPQTFDPWGRNSKFVNALNTASDETEEPETRSEARQVLKDTKDRVAKLRQKVDRTFGGFGAPLQKSPVLLTADQKAEVIVLSSLVLGLSPEEISSRQIQGRFNPIELTEDALNYEHALLFQGFETDRAFKEYADANPEEILKVIESLPEKYQVANSIDDPGFDEFVKAQMRLLKRYGGM